MYKKILKVLSKREDISDYIVQENKTLTTEQFYVMQKLETARQTDTLEDEVTIYKEYLENGKKVLGQAKFNVNRLMTSSELNKLIDEAVYVSNFAKNEYYELVKAEKKMQIKEKALKEGSFEILENIAKMYFEESTEECSFNSLELFFYDREVHLLSSKGVNYLKKTWEIVVEAIPSYKSDKYKTELYRLFHYTKLDYKRIKEDIKESLSDVLDRAKIQSLNEDTKKSIKNVIIKDKDLVNLFEELISTYDYFSVYSKSNIHKIGDNVQDNPSSPLTLSLKPLSKANFFDSDGVLLKEREIIQNGVLIDYYGNNRFAQYLGEKPSGDLNKVKIECGKFTKKELMKNPHLEISDLSGLQVDLFAGYIGGEIRLAKYREKGKEFSVSGISFSADLKKVINTIKLSKEKGEFKYYEGPKYALIEDVIIN